MTEPVTFEQGATKDGTPTFADLVQRYRRLVYALCLSEVGNPADAEDLVQEVFVRVHRDLPSLREPEKFPSWLRQVARNTCLMWVRRRPPASAPLEAVSEQEDSAVELRHRQAELGEIVKKTLARVSPKSREVLALHYLAGCSEAEIAEALGISTPTVKSRLHEGRKQAKRELQPLVKELLSLETRSEEQVDRILARCGSPGCICPETLTEGR